MVDTKKIDAMVKKIYNTYKDYYPLGSSIYSWCNSYIGNDSFNKEPVVKNELIELIQKCLDVNKDGSFDIFNENKLTYGQLFHMLKLGGANRKYTLRHFIFLYTSIINPKQTLPQTPQYSQMYKDLFLLYYFGLVKIGITRDHSDNGALEEIIIQFVENF